MTKRSSFVMPPLLVSVAATVDIFDRSQKSLMQYSPPCAGLDSPDLAGLGPWASSHGNIAVKALPIRLLARCTAMSAHAACAELLQRLLYCGAQTAGLTALSRGDIAPLHANSRQTTIAGKNSPGRPLKSGHGFAATLARNK